MKSIDGPTVRKLIKLILLFIFTIYVGYTFYYNYTYKSIGVELKKNTSVEYNSNDFNIKKFIKKVDGKIISINNEQPKDVIEYSFLINDEEINLLVEHKNGELEEIEIEKDLDEDLGIIFTSAVFDGVKRNEIGVLLYLLPVGKPLRPAV